nr:MAG: hypothetical protein [Microvirus sp.]
MFRKRSFKKAHGRGRRVNSRRRKIKGYGVSRGGIRL